MKHKFNLLLLLLLFVSCSSVFGDIAPADIFAYYSFDVNYDDDAGDRDLTMYGAPSLDFGILNNCYEFDGYDDYFLRVSDIGYNDVRAISFWVYVNDDIEDTDDCKVFVGKGKTYFDTFCLRHNTNDMLGYSGGASSTESLFHKTAFGTGAWHFVLANYNNRNSLVFYFDNVFITENGLITDPWVSIFNHTFKTSNFSVAGDSDGHVDHMFQGWIDEIGLYTRNLTGEEISSLYNEGEGFNPIIDVSIPLLYNYNYTNDNIIDVLRRYAWNDDPNNLISINNTNFSMTFNTSIDSNCSAVVDRELNYTEAIKNNSEYKLLTTETQEHSITALNDSFEEGNHYLCLSCVSEFGYHNFSCDVELNFSLVLPIGVNASDNVTSNGTTIIVNINENTQDLINIYISFFLLLLWVVFVILTFTLKGKSGKTIQFFNILQLCFGFVSGTMFWGISILIGLPVVFVALGIFMGLIMKG